MTRLPDKSQGRQSSLVNLETLAAILVGGASLGVSVLVPLVWPQLDQTIGLILLGVCVLGLLAAALMIFRYGRRCDLTLQRRWHTVGMGQGWIEARVRNDVGDSLAVSWNAGADNEQISLWMTFAARRAPRKSNTVELIFDIDGTTFEWDLADNGTREFTIDGDTWRRVEALKETLTAMRDGDDLTVAVPVLGLGADFTLGDAFNTLEGAVAVGAPCTDPTA